METHLEFKDPAGLRLHPLQKHLPDPDKDSPEWHSFVDALSAAGPEGTPPLFVTPEGLIMDGGRRWRAARQLQWDRVPAIVKPETDAATLIVDSLLGQRNMSRGAKVYLCIGLMAPFVESSENRRLRNLKQGKKTLEKPIKVPKPSNLASEDIKGLCERLGVSDETYRRAVQVYELFHDPKCGRLVKLYQEAGKKVPSADFLRKQQQFFKEEFEPELLSGEKNLWNILSAAGGRIANEDQPRVDRQLEFQFGETLHLLSKRLGRFGQVKTAAPQVRAWLEGVNDRAELQRLEELGTLIAEEARKRTKTVEVVGKN